MGKTQKQSRIILRITGGENNMSFRTKHKVRNGKYVYVVRNSKGQITDVQNIGRSIRQDASKYSTNVPSKPRQGFLGDYGTVTSKIIRKRLY
jgi:hypothetical protein